MNQEPNQLSMFGEEVPSAPKPAKAPKPKVIKVEIAEDDDRIRKLYFSIGEVAKMFNVNTSLIRFWEKEFSILKPQKNRKGNRLFTQSDLDNFGIIYHLVKERGFTLQGAKDKLKENKSITKDHVEIAQKLKIIREKLVDIRKEL